MLQTELMCRNAPPPCSSMCGIAAFEIRKGPVAFTARVRCHASSECSWTGTQPSSSPIPAQLTTRSIPPIAAAASPTIRSTSAGSETSPIASRALPPRLAIPAQTAAVRSGSRPHTVTSAPSSAKAEAIPSPIPLEAPVTTARLLANLLKKTTSIALEPALPRLL